MDLILTPFTLGQSTVVTLPKKMGITTQMRLKANKSGSKITLEVIDHLSQVEKNTHLIKQLSGSMKVSSRLTPDQMNKVYDQETYDQLS